MTTPRLLPCLIVLGTSLLPLVGAAPATAPTDVTPAEDPWSVVPGILQRIVPPTFAPREFSITDQGAVEGGAEDCRGAIEAAIAACHEAGGGRVVVPPGRYLTGPIHLRSNVELHLSDGAEIIFSDRFEDYLPPVLVRVGGVELYNYSPLIYARDAENIAVTGPGRLNGNAEAWWDWKSRETREFFEMGATGVPVEQRVFGTPEAAIRPSFLTFLNCTNILLEDFTIGSGPNWTIHPVYCRNTTIRRVHVLTDGPNNDGIDPDSCVDMLIEDCVFDTGDDCVVLKSGYNEDGWRVGRPTENVIMRNCRSKRGHGGLVIGSEMSGDVRNVFMENCEFQGTDRAIRIKSRADRGGVVEQVYARNLKVRDMQREVIILNMAYTADRKEVVSTDPPVFRNMRFENIVGEGAPTAILIRGMPSSPIKDIHLSRIRIKSTRGVDCSDASGLMFDKVYVVPTDGPVFELNNTAESTIQQSKAPADTDVFLHLKGERSREIVIDSCDLSLAREAFAVSDQASPAAVTLRSTKRAAPDSP